MTAAGSNNLIATGLSTLELSINIGRITITTVVWGKRYSRRPVKKGAASKEHAQP
jgi:hypothetical protein